MTPPVLFIDFESRSPVDLRGEGLMRYARHPLTEALCMAFAFDRGEIGLITQDTANSEAHILGGQEGMYDVHNHVSSGGLVVAHNAQFELAIWNFVMAKRFNWPRLRIEQVRCTMAAAYAMGFPGALENTAPAMGLGITKDREGHALMMKMCKPRDFVQGVPVYFDTPEARARLGEYCKRDVAVERDIYYRVYPLSDKEQQIWCMDQRINLRGIPFDMPSLNAALDIADVEKERLNKEMARVTEGKVAACSALIALKEWAADFGVFADKLDKVAVKEWLDEDILPEPVEEALLLRQSAGRFTSISKLAAIKRREMSWRVFYALQYHAATTGRWAGRGIQPHNFTRDLPEGEAGIAAVEDIMAALRRGDARYVTMMYDEPSIMISKCLRGFIHANPGKKLMGGDFANVEGRGIAWLAGEEWKLDAFRECDLNPHLPDMYVRAYAKTFSRDPATVTKTERQIGKVEELAFGYQGGVGAFRTMGKTYNVLVVPEITEEIKKRRKGMLLITEAQADEFKRGWRTAHTRIVPYWYALERSAIAAVREPGTITHAGAAGREVRFRKVGSFLWCRLPSGRNLCYPYPVVVEDGAYPKLTFKSVPDAVVWGRYTKHKEAGTFNDTYIVEPIGTEPHSREWCRVSTYGGKLSENITQAICRDLLADAMLRVEAAGFPIVVHVHDEIIVEGAFTEADRERFEKLMLAAPAWAPDFPIAADCWLSARYIKE